MSIIYMKGDTQMKKANELKYTQLKNECKPSSLNFETTEELKDSGGIIGQERGIKSLEFGTSIDVKGYNIFIEGPTGVGKTLYTKNFLDKISKKKKAPNDWCYIYNFDNPNEPIAVSLPAGQGSVFHTDMNNFIKEVTLDIKNTFNNDDFEKEKALLRKDFDEKKSELMQKLNEYAAKYNFEIRANNSGIFLMPLVDGKAINEDEFEKLPYELKKDFEAKSLTLQEQVLKTMEKIKILEKNCNKKSEEWQQNIALLTVNVHINELKTKYKRNTKIQTFLKSVKEDILKNIPEFLFDENSCPPLPTTQPGNLRAKPWEKYKVNLFVDNSKLEGAPVIMDSNSTYYNIFGKLEYENQFGALKTDHTMLRPGLLHKANGGYIVFQARDLICNSFIWEQFKKALRTKELNIDNARDQANVTIISLKPEPIPLKVKVILLGNSEIYHTLLAFDDDFRRLFKIKSEFEENAPRNSENILLTAQFIHSFCEKEGFPHLDKEAVAKIIEFSTKLTNEQTKLTTQLNELAEIIGEACTWAKLDKAKIVTKEYVVKALKERVNRVNKYDKNFVEMITDGTILIDTEGFKVGQINGLSILQIGNYCFGKPSRITVNTYIGKSGIVNIEREVSLSGTSHSKGVLILAGYIGEKFAQNMPLSLTASICFEQLYSGVDGDSASSTELYALLSSLSEIPINQSIAVTGSVNQKGEIQPIGGVTEKIEGFYNICKIKGLTGEQGIMIPEKNIKNLNLSDEIIECVKKGKFHIYSINNIDEGIEILTGVPAGKIDSEGNYPPGTVNYLVYEKLKKYSKNNTNK